MNKINVSYFHCRFCDYKIDKKWKHTDKKTGWTVDAMAKVISHVNNKHPEEHKCRSPGEVANFKSLHQLANEGIGRFVEEIEDDIAVPLTKIFAV